MPTDDHLTRASPPDLHEAHLALRTRAEERRRLVTQAADHYTPAEMQRLVQELQVQQIELEMQNEELLLAQAEAQAARAQYVDLYDFAPVGYFTLTPTGVVEQLNLCASRQLGAVRQRLVGRRFVLFVAPDHRLAFGQFLTRVFETDHTQSGELQLLREDGTPFFGQLEGLRVEGPTGPQCRLAVLDSTARHQAAEALAASEARFRKLFADSNDAVVLLQDDHYVECNAAALRLLGAQQPAQLVGQPAWAHAPERQPDGRRTADVFRETVAAAIRTGSQRCDARMRRVSGEEIWVEAVLTPFELGGPAPLIHIGWRDVTAARAAAAQLRESEARLSLALAASETGVFTWEFATNQVQWDERAQAVLGQTFAPGAVPVDVLLDRVHPDDAARARAAIAEARAAQAVLALDYRVVWPDGSVHHVSSAGRTVVDAQGQAYGFAGVVRDVTVRRAVEDELHYKSLVLERLLAHMPMLLSRFRPDGCYLEAAGTGFPALGFAENELVGRHVFDVFPSVRADLEPLLRGGQIRFLAELEVAGEPVAFQNYGFFDEQRQQAVVLSVDVTAATQQKHQLRREKEFTESLLNTTVDGILALDHAGRITAWNAAMSRFFDLEAALVLGRPLFEVLPHLDESAHQAVGRTLAGERVVRFGRPFPSRPGHYDMYLVPLPPAREAHATGILIIVRDMTERNQLAEEATRLRLRQQQAVLAAILTTQETERKRIAEALHNGLGQLLYATKLSLESCGQAPASVYGALRLLEEAIRATRTISFELTPGILEDFGLRTALEELVKRVAPARLPVRLHLAHLDQRLPAPVEIAVYRIVQELLNNVMKHAQATEVEVHVVRNQDRVEVSVEDNGRGFEPAVLASQPLTGIGLAGVRNRVALLGGELSVNSQLGRGTIISFELSV